MNLYSPRTITHLRLISYLSLMPLITSKYSGRQSGWCCRGCFLPGDYHHAHLRHCARTSRLHHALLLSPSLRLLPLLFDGRRLSVLHARHQEMDSKSGLTYSEWIQRHDKRFFKAVIKAKFVSTMQYAKQWFHQIWDTYIVVYRNFIWNIIYSIIL